VKKFILIAITAFTSLNAFASSQVCSGERLYVSDVRADFGTRPPDGAVSGSHIIVFDRETLLSYESIVGLFPHGVPPYRVSYEADQKILEEISFPAYIEKTYRVTAVLNRVDSLTHEVLEEIGRETVVCRNVQKFVP
jgi:hypothetical protein